MADRKLDRPYIAFTTLRSSSWEVASLALLLEFAGPVSLPGSGTGGEPPICST